MPTTTREPMLSYSVMRLLENLRKPLRLVVIQELDKIIQREGVDTIQFHHFSQALGIASEKFVSDFGVQIDQSLIDRSLADISAGRFKPIQDVIDAFHRKCA